MQLFPPSCCHFSALPCSAAAAAEEELRERELFLAGMQQRRAELQRQVAANLLPDPLTAVATATSAYSTEQGFRELSAQELSVAVSAGGLIDLLLDVRTHAEFAAGGL